MNSQPGSAPGLCLRLGILAQDIAAATLPGPNDVRSRAIAPQIREAELATAFVAAPVVGPNRTVEFTKLFATQQPSVGLCAAGA